MSIAETPWHAAYPPPRNKSPTALTRHEVLALLRDDSKEAGRDYVLVDLRRNDHEGGTIRGSINLPAQSLHPTIPTLYQLFKLAGLRNIVWYCSSSRGRGPRAAVWFMDYIHDQGDEEMQSYVLTGGITGWAKGGDEFVEQMIEFDGAFWEAKSG